MKKLLLYLLLLPALAFGQISKKQIFFSMANSSGAVGSGYGSGVHIKLLTGLDSARQNILRDGTAQSFTINVPTNYYASWEIVEATTQVAVASGSGLSGNFTPDFQQEDVSGFGALPSFVKEYDLKVTATKSGNSYTRRFRKIIKVLTPIFNEGAADVVWDLSASTAYKDGAYTDRPGYKIFVKGSHTGAGYLAFEQWRSSNPKNPIVIQFSNTAKVTINTSSGWLIQANFDCQNLIIDGAANPSEDYGFTGTFTSAGSQGVRIQPADVAVSTTTTAGYNIAIVGIEIDGNRSGGSGINVNFDSVTGAAIQYDTWSFNGFSMSNCRVFDTTDEGLYIGRFNGQLVSGYAKPAVRYASISYNIVDTSGGDGFQFGILFDSDISNNTGINLNWRNATDHRNLFQLVDVRNTYFYQNKLYNNTSEGGSTLWNIETGRGGSDFHIFSNLLVNKFTGAHGNGITIIDENEYNDTISGAEIYNNTIILHFENSIEVWRRTTGVATVLNPFRIVDNAILNVNDPDAVVYINTPNQSGYTVSNLFSQSSSSFGFVDYAGGDYHPASLSSALFGTRTSFSTTHPCANEDVEGYEFKNDIRGCYSGVPLIIKGAEPDVTAPTLSAFTIEDATPNRVNFTSSEIITATTYSGFTLASPSKTITGVTINSGQTTGHYFTVNSDYVEADNPTIAYSGSGSNLVDASSNALASFTATAITNNVVDAAPVDVKINFFTGTASGWIATGATSPKPGTDVTQDFGQLGSTGVGLRALNSTGDTWNATGASGTSTGGNTGVFPDAVLLTYWYGSGTATPTLELYNHTGTPLTGNTFTIVLTGSRAGIASRLIRARVNGGTWSSNLDVANNTANSITFTGVSAVAGVISVEIDSIADDFCYINGLTIISE